MGHHGSCKHTTSLDAKVEDVCLRRTYHENPARQPPNAEKSGRGWVQAKNAGKSPPMVVPLYGLIIRTPRP